MNILIIADKKTSKEYSELLSATPNINVLGVVSNLNSIESIQALKIKYSPLGLVVDTSVKHKGLDISLLIKALQNTFSSSRILLFADYEEIELFSDFGLFAVIGNTITSIQFNDIIKAFVNNEKINSNVISQEQTERYIKRNTKTKISLNKKFIPLIFIALVIIILIVCFVLKNSNGVDNLSTPDEVITTTTSSSTIPTEEKTTISSIIETFTSSTNDDVSNNQVIVNTTTIPPSTVPTTTQTITTTQQPTTKKVVKKKTVNKPNTSNNSSVNNTPIQTQPVTKKVTKSKPKTQTQVKIDYGNNNWSNNGKEDTKISISYLSKTLEVADSVSLSATVTPKKKKVHWSSSDTSVATVKQNGYVKAKSVGTAVITATANGKTATCTIYVKRRT